jgi:hypothetical protein
VKVGAAQVCITPPIGIDLGGYVDRIQPSIGVHDELYVRALYIEAERGRLLWLHCDLIGLSGEFTKDLKKGLRDAYKLEEWQVIISTTHTHSGPVTIHLRHCGNLDETYLIELHKWLHSAAGAAMADLKPVDLYFAEGRCALAVDRRRGSKYQHVDHRTPVLAFRRKDHKFQAILVNYAMHNVALSYRNRLISGDVAGIAAEHARMSLPGGPVTLVTNGGCASTVPPKVSPDPQNAVALGKVLGDVIVETTHKAEHFPAPTLASLIKTIDLPLTVLSRHQVLLEYERAVARSTGKPQWLKAIEDWKDEALQRCGDDTPPMVRAELQMIRIGPLTFTAVGAEVFSRLAEDLRAAFGPYHYVVGYANGNVGYLPFFELYSEGGYEVDTAYKFYGQWMVAPGSYEIVRDQAILSLSRMAGVGFGPKKQTTKRIGL